MKRVAVFFSFCLILEAGVVSAQTLQVDPRVLTKTETDAKVTLLDVAPKFVTTIRLPDPVNSVVVGDPANFQVEHSDREPKLVFVKALSTKATETNLLISTTTGHQVNLLLVNRGPVSAEAGTVDFLVRYELSSDFFVSPSGFPFALVGATVPLAPEEETALPNPNRTAQRPTIRSSSLTSLGDPDPKPVRAGPDRDLDELLTEQESAALPPLYGAHTEEESVKGDRVRTGVSRVIDGGQQVIVLFSVINPTKHAILLMPPQVQLGGTKSTGKVVRHQKWTTAEQLPVKDFRLNRRRLGLGERADGVVVFERPPYKQSNETLLLQVAESGAVDRPALAPIGFGVTTALEEQHDRGK